MFNQQMYNPYMSGISPFVPQQQNQSIIPQYYNQIQTRQDGGIYTNIIYVNDENAAKNYNLPPNSNFALWDNDKGIIYHKTVDNTGRMSIVSYDIVPHQEVQVKQPEYALKSDLTELQKEISKLRLEVNKK